MNPELWAKKKDNTRGIKGVLFLSFIILLLAAGCAQFTLSDAAYLRKGMSIEETLLITEVQPVLTFILGDVSTQDKIEVYIFRISSGDYRSNYLIAFKNDALLYWGYPHEFARSKDALLNEIGEKAVKQIELYEPVNQFNNP
ncbi:MAG: hypothetical protein K9N06_13300 [Candidatus Cloacimonetes bacterium]|nr:hypothetical protein [Candidatus Cloacimonadota bacterium]